MLTLGGVTGNGGESGDGVAELAADGEETLARPLLLLLPMGLFERGWLNDEETVNVSLVSNDSSLLIGSALMSSTSISSIDEELLL